MGWSAVGAPLARAERGLRRAEFQLSRTTWPSTRPRPTPCSQVYLCPSEPRKTYWNQSPGPPPDPYPSADADYGGMYGPRGLGSVVHEQPAGRADDLQPVHQPGPDHRRRLADDRRRRGPRGDQCHVDQRPQHLRPVGPDQCPSSHRVRRGTDQPAPRRREHRSSPTARSTSSRTRPTSFPSPRSAPGHLARSSRPTAID